MRKKMSSALRAGLVAIAVMPATVGHAAPAGTPSIAALLSYTAPGEVRASADGRAIVWVENREGVRNVMIARAPDFKPRALTDFTVDDGQSIGGSAFEGGYGLLVSPDASRVLFVRGARPDAAGYVLNPLSKTVPAQQTIYIVDTTTRTMRALGQGYAPNLSPDGETLAYLNGGKLLVADITTASPAPAVAVQTRGMITAAKWSPDGTRLLLTVNRGRYSLTAIYTPGSDALKWIAPDVSLDDFAVWSMDGKRVAFLRAPGQKSGESFNLERTYPFEIVVADAATGEGRVVHRSNARAGGFAQFYLPNPLIWAADDRLLFYSEQNGWMQMFSLSAKGGAPVALTPVGCEAETSDLSPSRRTLYVTHNCGDLNGRRVASVPVGGGSLTPIQTGTRLTVEPVALNDEGDLALKVAGPRQPVTLMLKRKTGLQQLSSAARDYPASALVEPKDITFTAADGTTINGQLFLPPGNPAAKMPAMVYVHGGPIRQMFASFHPFGYYSVNYAMNQYLALRGYAVLAVNYRSGIGYGQAFRTMPNQGPRGASEYQDVLAARAVLAARTDVDPARIGIWGGSYGGLLTATALARDSDKFAVGVDLHGVHNWRAVAEAENGGGWGIDGEAALRLAYQSSPVASAGKWTSPVLLIHGDADHSVNITESVDLAARLREQGTPVEVLMIPDEEHDFLLHSTWQTVLARSIRFLDAHLNSNGLARSLGAAQVLR